MPVPPVCSPTLAQIIEKQQREGGTRETRPIFPNLPFSPYRSVLHCPALSCTALPSSPCSSPRVRRRPLKETKQASTEQLGEYTQVRYWLAK